MNKVEWKVKSGHTIALCTSECEVAAYNSRNNLLVVYGYKTESVFSTNGATTKDVKKFVKKFLSSECDIFKCRNKKFTLVGYERTDVVSREEKTSEGTWHRRTDGFCWFTRDGREVARYFSPIRLGDDNQGELENEILENELRAREAFEASLKALEDLK